MINAKKQKLSLIVSTLLGMQTAYALPTGGQVVQGTATITTPNSATMNVTNSNNAIINWQQFNIGAGQTTNFIQPNSNSSVLNQVIGNNPSQILGNLNSNGQVYLINQHGILVGEGARINTNGFFASTLNITNDDFLNGDLKFAGGGLGGIDNKGYIHAGEDGNVVLVAPNIENGGVIEVENGNIILAAGESITITSLENSSVEFNVQSADNKVTNLGSVIAKNGAANLFAGTLKHTGSIRATGLVRDENGIIRLVALDKNEVSGTVDATGDVGGNIQILGDSVEIQSGAYVDASGNNSGGEILIGGDQQGLNPDIQNATSTTVEQGAAVHADGGLLGDGGRVIVFASNDVHVHEQITAKGGSISGDGGFIETSGLAQLDISVIPDATAVNGNNGEWLIDPNNITIVATSGNDDAVFAANPSNYTSTNDGTTIDVSLIQSSLNSSQNVIISTGAGGTELGDINFNAGLSLSASTPGSLTLNAHNNININADIDVGFGLFDLTLNANLAGNGGVVNFDSVNIDLGGGNLTLSGDHFTINNTVHFSGIGGQINLSSTLHINPLASLSIAAPGLTSTPTIINNSSGIINNGTLQIDGACNDGCGRVIVDGVVDNNGLIDFIGGELRIDGTLNLNTGSSFNVQSPASSQGGDLNINNGILNVNDDVSLGIDLNFILTDGTINDFHNLTLSHSVSLNDGTINFSEDIFGLYTDVNGVTPNIFINSNSALTFNGSATGNYFLYTGKIDWFASGLTNDINLNNVDLRLIGDFTIGGSQAMNINGSNGSLSLLSGTVMSQQSDQLLTINVPVIANGRIEMTDLAGQITIPSNLTLAHGGSLEGIGTFNGNVTVNSGGKIAPGIRGFANDNTGILNINGNLQLNSDSLLEFDIDDDAINFDQINVSGNTQINGGDAYFFWDTLSSGNPILSAFIQAIIQSGSLNINGAGITPHDLPTYSGSSLTANGDNLEFDAGSAIAGSSINYWMGSANDDFWSSSANWSSGVPSDGDIVVVETDFVDIDVVTNNLSYAQLDADVTINSSSNLVTSGDLITLQEFDFDANDSLVSGAGTWLNFGKANFEVAGFDVTKNIMNYGSIIAADFNNSTNDFAFSSLAFTNNGNVLFYSNNTGMDIDFSASASGLINNGSALFLVNGSQTQFSGVLTNNGDLTIMSPQLTQSTVAFSNFFSNSAQVNLEDVVLQFDTGGALSLLPGSQLIGETDIVINNGAQFLIQTNTALGVNQNLTINDGTLYLASDLSFQDTFDWNGGIVSGLSGSTFSSLSGSILNMNPGFNNNFLTDVDMTLGGILNIGSNGSLLLANENTFSISEVVGVANVFNILNTAVLNGGGLIDIGSTTTINAFDGVLFNPKLQVSGTANFSGGASLSYLGLVTGQNSTINIDVDGVASSGDTLSVIDLDWDTGTIDGKTTGRLLTTGVTNLTTGTLIDSHWLNSGIINWNSATNDVFTLNNATLENSVSGVLNIFDVVQVAVKNDLYQNKAFSNISGTFINDGVINLYNSTLDLDGLTLVLGSNTSELNGSGLITGDVINSQGAITIGDPLNLPLAGALTIDGNYDQGANASLQIRVVDPVNGNFSYDTFDVTGNANLDGLLRISYFSNQVTSITESFSPFTFASRTGTFSDFIDTNGNILAIDFSNGGFTILGTSSQIDVPIQDVLQSQEEFKEILKILKEDELNESLAFIRKIIDERDDRDEDEEKYQGPKLVCK